MREIKFRGQTYDTPPHWVFGDLYHYTTGEPAINYPHPHKKWIESKPVRPATVGQFTGLYDCTRSDIYPKGRPIYEGDIIKVRTQNPYWRFRRNFVVTWGADGWLLDGDSLYIWFILHTLEVIGNIYDNPNLLEVDNARD